MVGTEKRVGGRVKWVDGNLYLISKGFDASRWFVCRGRNSFCIFCLISLAAHTIMRISEWWWWCKWKPINLLFKSSSLSSSSNRILRIFRVVCRLLEKGWNFGILLVSGNNDNGFELVFGCLQAIFGAARRENTEHRREERNHWILIGFSHSHFPQVLESFTNSFGKLNSEQRENNTNSSEYLTAAQEKGDNDDENSWIRMMDQVSCENTVEICNYTRWTNCELLARFTETHPEMTF